LSVPVEFPRLDDGEISRLLVAGAQSLALPLSAAQVDRLVAYLRLLERWNATYNLTAVRDPHEMVTHHLLDCLAAAAALLRRSGRRPSERVLDVGSGAGLPGLVIAVAAPDTEVLCIDSVGKKTAFMAHAAGALGLSNLSAAHGRVESFKAPPFDVITSRAFASLGEMIQATQHLLGRPGVWMAMKGRVPKGELAQLRDVRFHVEPLTVPGLDAERCLVWISPRKCAPASSVTTSGTRT
jgi:16S rRNA (guanine527-N7)-methyltransferase